MDPPFGIPRAERKLPQKGDSVVVERDGAGWVFVTELSELARRKKKQVFVGQTAIALFLVGGQVYALRDVCIHKGRSLSKGTLLHGRIICPGHQWSFDPATGEVSDQPECQPTYAVRVDEGRVYVDPRQRCQGSETEEASHSSDSGDMSYARAPEQSDYSVAG